MPNSCCAVGCTNRKSRRPDLLFYSFPTVKENVNQRKLWINAIKRKDWQEEQINRARICSAHFISGRKSDDPTNPDYVPTVFSYNNNNNTSHHSTNQQRLQRFHHVALKRKHSNSSDNNDKKHSDSDCDVSNKSEESDAEIIARLLEENDSLKKENKNLKERNASLEMEIHKLNEDIVKINNDSIRRMNESMTLKKKIANHKNKIFSYKRTKSCHKMHLFYTGISKNVFSWLLDAA